MELQFNKDGNNYIAEFTASDDFNLHIEREDRGFLKVMQRTTASGAYDNIQGASFNYTDPVIDVDFTAAVYPQYIRVISFIKPTMAEVTFA